MEQKFNIVACRSCKSKICSRYLFYGSRSSYLVPSKDLGKPDCLFVRKISNSPQFQTLRLSSLEFRMALRGFSSHGEWNPSHLSSLKRQKELCFKLIQQGKLKVLSPPYNGNDLIAFKKWTEEEPYRGLFFRGGIPIGKKREEEKVEAALFPPITEESHWIEYRFVDSAGNPVPIDYDFIDPKENMERSRRAENGKIYKGNLSPGTCRVLLHHILSTDWVTHRLTVNDEAQFLIRVGGFPNGTPAKIEIFRLFHETADDVIATLLGSVSNNEIRVKWRYEPGEQEYGKCEFIAKATVGHSWAKTRRPLEVIIPELRNARWSEDEIRVGQGVQMTVDALGLPSGREVSFTVFQECYDQDDIQVFQTSRQILKQQAQANWTCSISSSDRVAIYSEVEYYFIAQYEKLRAFSNPLWVENSERIDQPPQIEEVVSEEGEEEKWEESPFYTIDDEEEMEEDREKAND